MYQYSAGSKGARPRITRPAASRRVVVVRRDKRKQRNMLLIPLVAGAALIGTGGTFGLWYATTHFSGGEVIAGNLDLEITDQLTWFDVSPDRTDSDPAAEDLVNQLNEFTFNGLTGEYEGFYNEFYNTCTAWIDGICDPHAPATVYPDPIYDASTLDPAGRTPFIAAHRIDCIGWSPSQLAALTPAELADTPDVAEGCEGEETWKMVPGDTIIGLIKAKLTLEGDNLVAGLEYECDDMTAAQIAALGALTTGDIADLVKIKTDLFIQNPAEPYYPASFAAPMDVANPLGTHGWLRPPMPAATTGAHLNYLGYFEAPGFGQEQGLLDHDWTDPGGVTPGGDYGTPSYGVHPIVWTLPNSVPEPDPLARVGQGEVVLMIAIHFSENADENQLAHLPLAQIFSGRLALSQVRGPNTPGQFIQTP